MTVLFLIITLVHLAQLLLVVAYAAGHQWCLPVFFFIAVLLFLFDFVVFLTVYLTNKQIERDKL